MRSPENATRWVHKRLASPAISLRRIATGAFASVALLPSKSPKMRYGTSVMRRQRCILYRRKSAILRAYFCNTHLGDVLTVEATSLGHLFEVQDILRAQTLQNGNQASASFGRSHRPRTLSKLYQLGLVYPSELYATACTPDEAPHGGTHIHHVCSDFYTCRIH